MIDAKDAKGMTSKEIEDVIADLKVAVKELKVAEKANIAKTFKETVKVGDEVEFIFKGESEGAEVTKINDSTFTVEIDGAKKAIRFDKFVAKIEADVEVVEDEAEGGN